VPRPAQRPRRAMPSAEQMQMVFTGVGVLGVIGAGHAAATGNVFEGVVSVALGVFGLAKRRVPRGKPGCDIERQTKFIEGSGEFIDAKDEDGRPIKLYCGEKGVLGLPLQTDTAKFGVSEPKPKIDGLGLVSGVRPDIVTIYDLIFKQTFFDDQPALGRCIRQHTFKDAMKDGKPNPKPVVVDVPGEWECITFKEMKRQARVFGSFLRSECGVAQREKLAIWSINCAEWMLADLACSAFNYASVSVYDSLGPDAASFIVADSGAQVLIVEDKCFEKVPTLVEDPVYRDNKGADLKVVVCLGKGDAEVQKKLEATGLKVHLWSEIQSVGKIIEDTPPTPEDTATIMYTSGTTGNPKGVRLSQTNITSTVSMFVLTQAIPRTEHKIIHLCYLPLAHILERENTLGLLFMGATVYFATSGARYLLADLSVVRPTVFAGVPKVYENVRDAILRKMTGFKKTLFETALACKTADLETGCGYHPIWDWLVFNKTKKALGGRVMFCVTGGAPISKDTLHFVASALAPPMQGYGATETCSVSTVAMPFDPVFGHVGPPFGSACIRLVDVPEMNYYAGPANIYKDSKAKEAFSAGRAKGGGEIWIGGPGVSTGYYDPSVHSLKKGLPSNGMDIRTKEDFFSQDGWSWFKTGDIGIWTDRGTLRIVDRKKNMFKTSLGEYVPVEEVEKVYQDNCPFADFVFVPKETKVAYVAICVVVSDSISMVMKWAKENGVQGGEEEVVQSDAFKALLLEHFEAAAKAKKLQRFLWVAKKNIYAEYLHPGYQDEWVHGVACANGHKEQLLTATFKPRRTQLNQYFAPAFPNIYPDRPGDHILP